MGSSGTIFAKSDSKKLGFDWGTLNALSMYRTPKTLLATAEEWI